MRVAFVAADIGNNASGVANVVRELARNLAARDKMHVTIIAIEHGAAPTAPVEGAELHTIGSFRLGRGLEFAPGLLQAIMRAGADSDCIVVHGFWTPSLVLATAAARLRGLPVMLSPHGMFSDYSFDFRGLRKRVALRFGFGRVLRSVTAFHATSPDELREIRALGLTQPVHVVANGVALPEPRLEDGPRERERAILFMSRIHPKKGLPLLVRCWASLAEQRPDWRLDIVGPDELSHAAEVKALAGELRAPRIRFLGPLYGKDKETALTNADLLVLPSYNENFGLVVAEALACGTPVVTTNRTPWATVEAVGCGWCVEPSIEGLSVALAEATGMPAERLRSMGRAGREFVAASYSWPAMAHKYGAALEATVTAARDARAGYCDASRL